jgi:membrane AbrB-like protein
MLLASIVLALGLQAIDLPAALLLGPMIAAICLGIGGATIRVPRIPYWGAQAVIGCLIASAITPTILKSLVADWPLFGGTVLATLTASSVLGWMMSRWRVMPGTTGVWGSSPGAATAMVVMAEAFGADARLVAFMQYVRVIVVSVAAALVAGLFVDTSGAKQAVEWFPALQWPAFGSALAVAAVGAVLGPLLRLPSPHFLAPFILGIVLHAGAGVDFQLPAWLLAATYCIIGWQIGLRFTREVLFYALKLLPQILFAIALLMAFCGLIAWWMASYLGTDALTAYLATSPGGMDSVAIVAAASGTVDLSLVMAMQILRFLIVLVAGPPLARWMAGKPQT